MSRNALIVGINKYQSQYLKDLKAPALDAETISQLLEADGDFKTQRLPEEIEGIDERKPIASKIQPVSLAQLKQALKQLFLPESQQAPDTALFYFSGHGLPDDEGFDKGYLAASDTNPSNSSSGLSLRWLQWLLSESSVKQQIIWLDCCHSGSLFVKVEAANPGHGESRDRCFIASSRDFEQSWEDLNSPYSVFTKVLLEGLNPKRLPGRWIDTFSLANYVNQALKGELQTPVCTNFGEAINLTRSWQVQENATNGNQVDSSFCPYKGLEFFDCNEEDPKYFFGREQLVGQLLDQVRTSNFIALVGASGNGKSSVLRAGLLHQLKLGQRISGSDQWRIRITRPDRQPMQNLALAFVEEELSDLDRAEAVGKATVLINEGVAGLLRLVQASTAPRTVLVFDQFEEVFTRCEKLEERELFFACLMGALAKEDNRLCLIIAMRADFITQSMEKEFSGLARKIEQHMVSVLPMKLDELRAAICKPAEQVNLEVEPMLVSEILNDIEGEPGSLPLLQYTLKILWQERSGNLLSFASYGDFGRIKGTLDKRATYIYNNLELAEQNTVQHIFQQLTQLGEGTADTRRVVLQDDLIAEPKHPKKRVQQIIDLLSSSKNRLIVTNEVISDKDSSTRMSSVDVAHEALIRHWHLVREWIERNRDLLRRQRKIENSAVEWRNNGKKPGYLLQGLYLIEAIQFKRNYIEEFALSDTANLFLQKSLGKSYFDRIKILAWLVIPAFIIIIVLEHNIRESSIKEDYTRLNLDGSYGEKQVVQNLVLGCTAKQEINWLSHYWIERFFGNCRELEDAPLEKAKLSSVKLKHANLANSMLTGANLSQAKLNEVDLTGANLSQAKLNEVDLTGANLSQAKLNEVDLTGANLSQAKLNKVDLTGARLSQAKLNEVVLTGANLSQAKLNEVDLTSANLVQTEIGNTILKSSTLEFADMRNADLNNVELNYANLSNADLRSVNFKRVKLNFVDFGEADLRFAKFFHVDLSFAKLINADLSFIDFNSTNFDSANFNNAILLNADFRFSKNLTKKQLQGESHPLICNSLFPLEIEIDSYRDCDKIADILFNRYPDSFIDIKDARRILIHQILAHSQRKASSTYIFQTKSNKHKVLSVALQDFFGPTNPLEILIIAF